MAEKPVSETAKTSGIYDSFFKRLCELPGAAAELCRQALPLEVFALYDWPRGALAKDSFHDSKRADLVLAAPLLSDPEVLTYIVIEHKSQYEPKKTYAQLCRYQTQFSDGCLEEHGLLPEVLPVFVHQGRRPYKGPLALRDALGHRIAPKSRIARKSMMRFEPHLLDLHDPRLEEVFKDAGSKIRGGLYLLRHVWDKEADAGFVLRVLGMFGGAFLKSHPDFTLNVVDYLSVGYKMKPEAWAEAEREAVRRGLLEKGGYMTIQEEIEERGRQEGRQARNREVILNMLQAKTDVSFISKVTGMPKAEIIKFKNGEFKNGKAE